MYILSFRPTGLQRPGLKTKTNKYHMGGGEEPTTSREVNKI